MHSTPNIIICCDGTDDTFGRARTNVRRIFDMVGVDGQVRYYDPGVGTVPSDTLGSRSGKQLSRWLGSVIAVGLTQNVLEAYTFLLQHFEDSRNSEEESRVFFFGFSRGALTVRRLAKFVDVCGLPPQGNTNLVPYAYDAYRSFKKLEKKIGGFHLGLKEADIPKKYRGHYHRLRSFRNMSVSCNPYFVGVWDTVRSVGLKWKRIGCKLSEEIQHGRHALSYHERRKPFQPETWDKDERIKQYWFAGDHADVGGGHTMINGDRQQPISDENDLSLHSLVWMLGEAGELKLRYDSEQYALYQRAAERMCANAFGGRKVNDKFEHSLWRATGEFSRRDADRVDIRNHPSLDLFAGETSRATRE